MHHTDLVNFVARRRTAGFGSFLYQHHAKENVLVIQAQLVMTEHSRDKDLQENLDFSDKDHGKDESTEDLSLQLDTGIVKIRKRNAWWKIWSV